MNRGLTRACVLAALSLTGLTVTATASAQTRQAPARAATPPQDPFTIRGFGDVGSTTFAAAQSFKAVLGTASGPLFGGGVEVDLRSGAFVSLRASRFRHDGHRVFIFEGETFELDVPTTVSVTPIEVGAGYRFDRSWRVVPYVGGGVGWHRYEETSKAATSEENVDATFRGYHLLGGAEVRMMRLVAAAVEAQWATVPDALGGDPNGVSAAFNEHNLGGVTFRVKLVVGH